MARTTKLTADQIEESKTTLRSILKPGTRITVVPVNNAGTFFKLYAPVDGEIRDITWNACRAMGVNTRQDSFGRHVAHETVVGMSRAFNLVYNLSHYLFDDGYALREA